MESYWDSTLQAHRSRSIYLGKIDEATGELIRGKKIHFSGTRPDRLLNFGHVTVCRPLAEDAGILPALRASFGEDDDSPLAKAKGELPTTGYIPASRLQFVFG